jgi:competence protein CoiA
MRQRDVPVSHDVPAFVVELPADHRPIVLIRSETLPGVYRRLARAEDDRRISQRIPLESFVAGTLNGRLKFAPAVGITMSANVMAANTSCWKCGGETRTVLGVELQTEKMFPGFGNVRVDIGAIDALGELGPQWVQTFLPAELLKKWRVGEIKIRQSKAAGEAYLSNGCVHCDALYGRHFYPELWYDVAPLFEIRVPVEPWMAEFPGRDGGLKRWWFDTVAKAEK